jgi:hypothetical protein
MVYGVVGNIRVAQGVQIAVVVREPQLVEDHSVF